MLINIKEKDNLNNVNNEKNLNNNSKINNNIDILYSKNDSTQIGELNLEEKKTKTNINNNNDNEKENLDENNINNDDFILNSNNENTKEELKKLFLEEIFLQKYTAPNYEINDKFFKEIIMPGFGNCFYCCLAYYI